MQKRQDWRRSIGISAPPILMVVVLPIGLASQNLLLLSQVRKRTLWVSNSKAWKNDCFEEVSYSKSCILCPAFLIQNKIWLVLNPNSRNGKKSTWLRKSKFCHFVKTKFWDIKCWKFQVVVKNEPAVYNVKSCTVLDGFSFQKAERCKKFS